jgi:hypothetical protein
VRDGAFLQLHSLMMFVIVLRFFSEVDEEEFLDTSPSELIRSPISIVAYSLVGLVVGGAMVWGNAMHRA